jgi:hypothetical protein
MKETIKYFKEHLWDLIKIYRQKKKGFTCDRKFPWVDGIRKRDFGVEKVRVMLPNGFEAIYCLFGADELVGRQAFGVKYDLIGFVGMKPIRDCTFKEFIRLYGFTILDGIDK